MDLNAINKDSMVDGVNVSFTSDHPPSDKFRFVYWFFFCLGVICVLPWFALLQALVFLDLNLPGRDIVFVIATAANGPVFLAQLIMLKLGKYLPVTSYRNKRNSFGMYKLKDDDICEFIRNGYSMNFDSDDHSIHFGC